MSEPPWEYTLVDFDPSVDDAEEWAQRLARDGWQVWHGTGAWIEMNGRRVQRWSLRRPRPVKGPGGSESA